MSTQTPGARSPRNVWRRLRLVLDRAQEGDFIGAERLLGTLRHDPDLGCDIHALYRARIAHLAAERNLGDHARRVFAVRPGGAPWILHSSDALRVPRADMLGQIRRLDLRAKSRSRFPASLVLPRITGARNDTGFLTDAAAYWAGHAPATGRIARVHVVYTPLPGGDIPSEIARLHAAVARLARTEVIDPDVSITVFSPDATCGTGIDHVPCSVLDPEAAARLDRIAQQADLVVFLTGAALPDRELLLRLVPPAEVSDLAVMPFFSGDRDAGEGLVTPFTTRPMAKALAGQYPFRKVAGLNFAVPASLLRRAGLPDPRFRTTLRAGRALAYRLFEAGAYFLPVALPQLDRFDDVRPGNDDRALWETLVPTPWDRKRDGRFEVPKVSVYIPAYNAMQYIRRAVDSVLEQDFEDLEICIAVDGAFDKTAEVLADTYADNARVRWSVGRNGGIGHASNRAISMARGTYIGQLDSDDCLKPGAIRRLATVLDEEPEIVCAYGSCERIDAQGRFVANEYSWPVFSREKMMLTSIVHHFRMFRKQAWERTERFREDIVNAVDYDMFLKLAETGKLRHVDEILYQRRWHGQNTSSVNEGFQTSNTHLVQRAALTRLGLDRDWDIHVPDPGSPRQVGYRRRPGRGLVVFWPDYSRDNPYPRLLYAGVARKNEVVAGPIEAALRARDTVRDGSPAVFHLHWLNFLFRDVQDADAARAAADDFLAKLTQFRARGGRIVWTVHNAISHESPFREVEANLSRRIAGLADRIHLHSAASLPEVQDEIGLDPEKLGISRHGSYVGVYPDLVDRAGARAQLGLEAEDDVILFAGQVRAYKGFDLLLPAFRDILARRPRARLLIAGEVKFDLDAALDEALDPAARARVSATRRFVEDGELQLFFRAADVAAFPYRAILTSGSLLLSLSFGLPAVVPSVGMTREVLEGRDAGALYDPAGGAGALRAAIEGLLARKDAGTLDRVAANARARAEELDWPDFTNVLEAGERDRL